LAIIQEEIEHFWRRMMFASRSEDKKEKIVVFIGIKVKVMVYRE